jgi:hypothetical protein
VEMARRARPSLRAPRVFPGRALPIIAEITAKGQSACPRRAIPDERPSPCTCTHDEEPAVPREDVRSVATTLGWRMDGRASLRRGTTPLKLIARELCGRDACTLARKKRKVASPSTRG